MYFYKTSDHLDTEVFVLRISKAQTKRVCRYNSEGVHNVTVHF